MIFNQFLDGKIKHIGDYESIQHLLTTTTNTLQTPLKSEEKVVKFEPKTDESEEDVLIEAERLHSGRQSLSLFYKYVQSFGLPLFVVYAFLLGV